jgi:hypothetical protein
MGLSSSEMKRLIEIGLTPEALLLVTEIIEERDASRGTVTTPVTEAGANSPMTPAERARKYREKKKLEAVEQPPQSVTEPVTIVTEPVTEPVTFSPTPPKDNTLSQVGIEEGKKEVTTRARGTRLPADFVPDEASEATARELKFSNRDWKQALQEFRDYWAGVPGAKGCKLDWQATFRNSIRRFAERRHHGKPTHQSAMAAAFDNLERKIGAHRDPDDGSGGLEQPNPSGLAY